MSAWLNGQLINDKWKLKASIFVRKYEIKVAMTGGGPRKIDEKKKEKKTMKRLSAPVNAD